MNKTINYILLFFTSLTIIGCSTKETNGIDLEIKEPHEVVRITPDYCKKNGLEERKFTIKIPETYKNYEDNQPNTIHYVSIRKKIKESSELLELASASMDLEISTNLVDGELNVSKSYNLMFDTYKPIIDKYFIEKGMQE